MTVRSVRVHVPLGEVVLMLEADGLDMVLPVTIGPREGAAIASVLAGIVPPRPLTHDLLLDLLRAAGAEVVRVEIVALRAGVFYAEIVLDDGARVDARTSDAVAVALRAGVPVLCDPDVLESAGELDTGEPDEDDAGSGATVGGLGGTGASGTPGEGSGPAPRAARESELAQFRAFLESVEPEDFEDTES
ncbi:bifunctional nuclease family protein [Serinibacter arcticus]|nr:bifunctional nuclease family protein [Serinibacter arcticus]